MAGEGWIRDISKSITKQNQAAIKLGTPNTLSTLILITSAESVHPRETQPKLMFMVALSEPNKSCSTQILSQTD